MLNQKMYRRLVNHYMVMLCEPYDVDEIRRRAELFAGTSFLSGGEEEAVREMWHTLKRWKEVREELKGEK